VFKRKRGSRPPMVALSTMLEITNERMLVPMSALLQRQRAKHDASTAPAEKVSTSSEQHVSLLPQGGAF